MRIEGAVSNSPTPWISLVFVLVATGWFVGVGVGLWLLTREEEEVWEPELPTVVPDGVVEAVAGD
jgi:hypothetical protein